MANRRSFVKSLFAAPFLRSLLSSGNAQDLVLASYPQRYLAVCILRHINTAQLWYKHDNGGRYADMNTLFKSKAMDRILSSDQLDRMGIGRSLHSSLNWSAPDIFPEWVFDLALTSNEQYLATIENRETHAAFTTDQSGAIFEGVLQNTSLQSLPPELAKNSAKYLLAGGFQINSRKRPSRLYLVIHKFNITPDGKQPCTFCQDYPCACGTQCLCQDAPVPGGSCSNCGCQSCVWCCQE